jgi:hypothetical protein
MRSKTWEVGMRRPLLATVSVVALGLGAAGMACAAGNMNSNAGTGAGSNMPNAAGTTQPGSNPGTGANIGTGASGYNQGMNTNTGMSGMTGSSQWGGRMSQRGEVQEIQQRLQADNLYSGKIDGRMGPETRKALRDYQQKNGLRVTARLDRQTLDSILGNGATGQGSSMPPGTGNMPQTQSGPSR